MDWCNFILQFLICAVSIGVAIIFYKMDHRHRQDQKTINKLADQVQAYWILEKEYCSELCALKGISHKKLLTEFRHKAQNSDKNYGKIRPDMTADSARKLKR